MTRLSNEDKQAFKGWEEFHRARAKEVQVREETSTEKAKRLALLEAPGNHVLWYKEYFPAYFSAEPADFHEAASLRVLGHKRWFELRNWSRELAKSTWTMFEVMYLALVKKELHNVLMVSNSLDNAERLLAPYKANLEANQRLIADYGVQENFGTWTSTEFVTRAGVSFRALGAGQSPRGTRNAHLRVDAIIIDDIDTDEECRNELLVQTKFKWIQEALIPTVSVSGDYRIWLLGNRIAKHCCAVYAEKIASHVSVVNIRNADGKSSWPQKNSEADIDAILSILSYASQQKEYFNNPISEGRIFKDMRFGPMRPLKDYKYLVAYTDPSFKDTTKNDYKATVLMGRYKDEFHILKAYVKQTTTAEMIDWHYQIDAYVDGVVPVYYYMESNFIQDILLAEFYKEGDRRGKVIPIKGDDRKKDHKLSRIEANLEPLNRNGKLTLNEDEKDSKGMQTLVEQFIALEPGSKAHDDGPDAVEGGVNKLNVHRASAGQITVPGRHSNRKRY